MQSENENTMGRARERAHLARQIGRLLAQEWVRQRALTQSESQAKPTVAHLSEHKRAKLP
jgi:hypothetical protein